MERDAPDGPESDGSGPGEAFGEITLLRAVPRTATVRAVGDTELGVLSGADLVAVTGFSATSSTG